MERPVGCVGPISGSKGRTVQDSDLMIAVFAKRLGATVVTHNTSHFELTGVPTVDWCS